MATVSRWKAPFLFGVLICGPSLVLLAAAAAKNVIVARPVFQVGYGPAAGEAASLGAAYDVVHALRRQEVPNYQLSDALRREPLIEQRIVEGAWPIKFQLRAGHVLYVGGKEEVSRCQVVSTVRSVQLCVRF